MIEVTGKPAGASFLYGPTVHSLTAHALSVHALSAYKCDRSEDKHAQHERVGKQVDHCIRHNAMTKMLIDCAEHKAEAGHKYICLKCTSVIGALIPVLFLV